MFIGSVGDTAGWYWHVRSVFWVLGLCFVSELNGDKCDTRLAAGDEVKWHPERSRATERRWSKPGSLASGRFYPCWHGCPRRIKVAPTLVTKIHSCMINWQKCRCVPNLDSCIKHNVLPSVALRKMLLCPTGAGDQNQSVGFNVWWCTEYEFNYLIHSVAIYVF